jgi:hypothetical protein
VRQDNKMHAPKIQKTVGSSDVCSQETSTRPRGLDAQFEPSARTMGRCRWAANVSSLGGSDGGSNSVMGTCFSTAVVEAMTLLDECADDIETAQVLARMRLYGDAEEIIWWGEVLEALRVNQRNQA